MCGIAGILTKDESAAQPEFAASVRRMTQLLRRRGPDDEGFWADPAVICNWAFAGFPFWI